MRPGRRSWQAAVALLLAATGLRAQGNILAPVDTIEALLDHGDFRILDERGARFQGDRTSRVALQFTGGDLMVVKWAPAASGGDAFNNSPRYEVAVYRLQKLFLGSDEIVVPPTVVRAFPLAWVRETAADAQPTFAGTNSVLVTLQYWLFSVQPEGFWDAQRAEADTAYARAIGNFNILTFLERQSDDNQGNFLISQDSAAPRIYCVDNGVAFSSDASDRGATWRRIRVKRLPRSTVDRLRRITDEQLVAQLETVAEFRVSDGGALVAVAPGPNLDPDRGVRRKGDRIQLGLTRTEIAGVRRRLRDLVERVDADKIDLF